MPYQVAKFQRLGVKAEVSLSLSRLGHHDRSLGPRVRGDHPQRFFEGSPDTRWARNLARDPRAVISVERGSEIVIVYGTVTLGARAERNVLEEVSRAYAKKYGRVHKYKPTAEEIEKRGINALVPSKALSWDVKTFGKSPTRFYFDTARAS